MKYRLTLMIVAALGFCHSAAAELVHFEFSGTVSGTLDVGGGAMAFNANPFTVVGDVTSTTDLSGDPNRGIFAATGTYNIAGIGTFVSDPGGDYYSQYGAAAGTIDRVGMVNAVGSSGFAPDFVTSPIVADPNAPQVIGPNPVLTNPFNAALPHFLSNSSGHSLTFTATNVTAFEITAPVPVPAAQWLFGAAMSWLGLRRRRQPGRVTRARFRTQHCSKH